MKQRKTFKTFALEESAAAMVDELSEVYQQARCEILRQAVISFFKRKVALNKELKKYHGKRD